MTRPIRIAGIFTLACLATAAAVVIAPVAIALRNR